MTFTNSDDLYTWLCSFINLERGIGGKPGEHFKLDRMRLLAELAGNPQRTAPVIHIAGSKGKGSVTAMISALLETAGKKPGRYMSPHVSNWRERISSNNAFFPEQVYVDAGNELSGIYRDYRDRNDSEPTFFELFTLYFFLCSRKALCDILVVETGLGGRLDATNIVEPLVSVITIIEKEHTEYLGNDIVTIAGEKAGIIKPGKPVILAQQKKAEITDVFIKTARENESPLFRADECFSVTQTELNRQGVTFSLEFNNKPFAELSSRYTVSIPGSVQAENAALAIMAAKTALPSLNTEAARKALGGIFLPARFERIQHHVNGADIAVVVDGAHTSDSVEQCVRTFCELYGEGGILLFGCAADKDVRALAGILAPHFSRCIITTPGTFRAASPEAAHEAFRAVHQAVSLIPDTETAGKTAVDNAAEKALPLLACGSFYLAGEVRKLLEN